MSLEIDQIEQHTDSAPVVLSTIQEPPDLEITPAQGWFNLDIPDLWKYRELIYFLTWRDIMVRYKQTALGTAWAVLQPLLTMVLFSVIFGRLAGLPSDGIPYPIFTFTALIPWGLFAYALTQSSTSLVSDRNLITKIYFPRLAIPLSSVLSGLLDFAISLLVLFGMMLVFRVPITCSWSANPTGFMNGKVSVDIGSYGICWIIVPAAPPLAEDSYHRSPGHIPAQGDYSPSLPIMKV